ncbi:MAG: protein-L-isoaspartate(D-aspartate) O-methyltransferase [Deltaproteobacteria bacterium]|nr:protein-L-isoaspartate(D-aspartate) O-methyltransferase [Deltaproteobacteria bacterium]
MPQNYSIARKQMVRDQLIKRGICDERVLEAMLKVPRHLFVEEALVSQAYQDHPINIGAGQTLSQPYMVAFMLEKLALKPTDHVLEVGMGCGYQTAVLAELVQQVYAIEFLQELFFKARKTLKKLAYSNMVLRLGDGSLGWPKYAPFDAIVVAAGGPVVPKPLLEQLKDQGRLILPVGPEGAQRLILVRKNGTVFEKEDLGECRFVPLRGRYGISSV